MTFFLHLCYYISKSKIHLEVFMEYIEYEKIPDDLMKSSINITCSLPKKKFLINSIWKESLIIDIISNFCFITVTPL